MTSLVDRVCEIAESLDAAGIRWALGGALALAYATEEPRGTRDIDLNVFVPAAEAARVFAALPADISHGQADELAAVADDQVRLWWDDTPIDVFFNVHEFHDGVAERCRTVPFAGRDVRVLAPDDLAVFKALFDRPRDWVDIDEMVACGALDRETASRSLAVIVGLDDPRVARLCGP